MVWGRWRIITSWSLFKLHDNILCRLVLDYPTRITFREVWCGKKKYNAGRGRVV
jgi:hypothetical protein